MRLYLFKLTKGDVIHHTGQPFSDDEWGDNAPVIHFECEHKKRRLSIERSGKLTVREGYSWDGCSPKWNISGFVVGTPDGAPDPETGKSKTWKASLFHDALCQFKHDPRMPYTRKQVDQLFRAILVQDGWEHAEFYYRAVRAYATAARLK